MTDSPLTAAVARVGHAVRPPNPGPDAALVGAFVRGRDEAAAAELVRRHGPMVYGVCRRLHPAEADDAFQAVWLVFSRHAGRVRPPGAVGPWLHGVAVKVATKSRTQSHTRRRRLMATARPEPVMDPPTDPLLAAVLDDELARLPDKYRLPVVLCDLGGKTRVEAAAELGWPEGTVATRLTQGRERLATRLRRRGVVVPTAGLAMLLAPPATAAHVPADLGLMAVRVLLATAAIPQTVLPLAKATETSVTQTKVILAAVGFLAAAGLTATGLGFGGLPEGTPVPVAVEGPAAWRLKSVHKNHGQMVYDAAFSPDGKTFATAGADGTVIVWDTATQAIRRNIEVVKNLPPPGPAVVPPFDPMAGPRLAAPDPSHRAAGSTPPGLTVRFAVDGQLRVGYSSDQGLSEHAGFDPTTGESLEVGVRGDDLVKVLHRGTSGLTFVRPDGTELPLETPGRDAAKPPAFDGVFDTAVSPDGKLVAVMQWSPERGSELRLCDATTGKSVVERPLFPAADTPPRELVFSPDGKRLAAGTVAGRLAVFTAPDWTEVYRLTDKLVRSGDALAFTPDGKHILSAGWREVHVKNWFGGLRSNTAHREVWVRDAATGELLQSLPVRPPSILTAANAATVAGTGLAVSKLAVAPDGRTLVVTLGDPQQGWPVTSAGERAAIAAAGEVRVYVRGDANPAPPQPKVEENPKPADGVERNQDLWVWQARGGAVGGGRIGTVAFTTDGQNLLTGDDGNAALWRLAESPLKPVWSQRLVKFGSGVRVAVAPDGRLAATAYEGDTQRLVWLDAATGAADSARGETLPGAVAKAVAFSPNGKRVALTDGRKLTVKDLGVPGETNFGPLDDSTPGPAAVAWAPDGKRLVFLPNVKVDPAWPGNGAKQPDAAKATHYIAQVWGAGSGEPMALLKHGPARVTAAAWSADGKRIVTADEAGEVVVWDGESFKERKRLKLAGPVMALSIAADGKRFAAGVHVQGLGTADIRRTPLWNDRIEVYTEWEPDNWLSSSRLGLPGRVALNAVAFSPDGKVLVAGGGDGLRVWDRVKLAPK